MLAHLYVFLDRSIPYWKRLHLKIKIGDWDLGTGAQNLLPYLMRELIVSVWMNQWMEVRLWEKFLVFIVSLNHLYFFFFLLCLYNCFCSKTKVGKNRLFSFVLCPFACSVSSASEVSFPFSLSSTIFPGGSDQRLPLYGHPSLFWMHGSLILFIPRECRILLCSVSIFLPCLMGESIVVRDGLTHLTSSKGYQESVMSIFSCWTPRHWSALLSRFTSHRKWLALRYSRTQSPNLKHSLQNCQYSISSIITANVTWRKPPVSMILYLWI